MPRSLTKVGFPREILPLTYVVAALVDMSLASLVLVCLMMWFGVPLDLTALWALPVVRAHRLLIGLGLLLSAVQVRYRDVGLAMPVLVQVWLFATPVIYPLAAARLLAGPFYCGLPAESDGGHRRHVSPRRRPASGAGRRRAGVTAAVVAMLLPAAYIYFKHVELTIADIV